MVDRLVLSKDRLPNDYQPGKAREWNQLSPVLQQYLEDLCENRRKWPLFLHGPVGSGKSCAALCVVDRVAKAEFYHMPALVSRVHSIKQGREEWYKCGRGGQWTERLWWDYVAGLPLLVLDDVGLREVHSDFQTETLFMALEARDGKPLVCTSNLNTNEIETSYNDRIRSRLCCGTTFELRGRDRRYEQHDLS